MDARSIVLKEEAIKYWLLRGKKWGLASDKTQLALDSGSPGWPVTVFAHCGRFGMDVRGCERGTRFWVMY